MQQRPAIPATCPPPSAQALCWVEDVEVTRQAVRKAKFQSGIAALPWSSPQLAVKEKEQRIEVIGRPHSHTQEDRWMLLDIEGISRSDAMTLDGSLQDIQRNQFHEV